MESISNAYFFIDHRYTRCLYVIHPHLINGLLVFKIKQ